MKYISLSFLLIAAAVFSGCGRGNPPAAKVPAGRLIASCCSTEGTCSQDKNCTACKNCKYCKHCSQNGGSCGVCR